MKKNIILIGFMGVGKGTTKIYYKKRASSSKLQALSWF